MAGDKYAALRAEFVAGTMTLAALAEKHGASYTGLRQVAARENWMAQRHKTSQNITDSAAKQAAEEVAELWVKARRLAAENFIAAQELQAAAIRALQDGEKTATAQDARAIMGSAVDGIRGLHMATGEPTEITEHRGGLALAQTDKAELDAMMREVAAE